MSSHLAIEIVTGSIGLVNERVGLGSCHSGLVFVPKE